MTREREIMWDEIDWFDDEDDDLDIDDDENDNTFDSDGGDNNLMKLLSSKQKSLIPTPFGPIPIDDVSSPLHNTRFFVGHLNFHLSKTVQDAINDVEGVEFLKLMSKYRFIIGVGLMFQPANVLSAVERAIKIPARDNMDSQIEEAKQLEEEIDKAESSQDIDSAINCVWSQVPKDQKWIAYVYPNGEHIIKVAKDDEQFLEKLKQFEELELMSHGVIMQYKD